MLLYLCCSIVLAAESGAELQRHWLEMQTGSDRQARMHWWRDVDANRLRSYLDAGADPGIRDRRGWTPLHSAARYSPDAGMVRALVAAGADVNARDAAGDTPLHWAAAENSNAAVVDALLTAGADVNARDRYGWLPLHSAADRSANPEILEALVRAGANRRKRAYFVLFSPKFLLRHNGNMSDADKDIAMNALDGDR